MKDAENHFRSQVIKVVERERKIVPQSDLTRAAVLVPIVFRDIKPHLILTKRTMTVATHKGQISFPGGVREPEDADIQSNALREAKEEIGIHPDDVEVVGMIDDFSTMTGFIVTPVVGFVADHVEFRADPAEVEEIFEVPFDVFLNTTYYKLVKKEHAGYKYEYHQYSFGKRIIWGATAGIIHRFVATMDHEVVS
jgi:8-oxo-dGTP pyrophosphatase MutT (NUDIX family)